MLGPAQHGDESRRLFHHPALPVVLGLAPPLLEDAAGGLVALVEDPDDRAGLAADRGNAVRPIGLRRATFTHHRQHLVEQRLALASGRQHIELLADHVPDVGPHFARRASKRPRMAFGRDRRPGVVVKQAKLRTPVDRGREARMQADPDRGAERLRPRRGCASGVTAQSYARTRRPMSPPPARIEAAAPPGSSDIVIVPHV